MKKFLILIALISMICTLTGCYVTSRPVVQEGKVVDTYEVYEEYEEVEPQQPEYQLLSDSNGLKVSLVKVYEEPTIQGVCYLQLLVENKTNKNVTIYPQDSYVNDMQVMIGSGIPMEIAPGKKSMNPFFFSYTNVGITRISQITSIETKLRAVDDNFNTVAETEPIVISTVR
jgi:hypothetical protein